jgi:hypothetical protein
MAIVVDEPIINSPFAEPTRHYRPSGDDDPLHEGRRPSGYTPGLRTRGGQTSMLEDEYVELPIVNEIRGHVARWREAGYPGATRTTLDLLRHWQRPERDRRLFFCQLEAAETAIWLVEGPQQDVRLASALEQQEAYVRHCLKMATGSGKTIVMGMLIAWSLLNKARQPNDKRFSDAEGRARRQGQPARHQRRGASRLAAGTQGRNERRDLGRVDRGDRIGLRRAGGGSGVARRAGAHQPSARDQPSTRPVGHAVLSVRFGPRRGNALRLDRERLLSARRHRVRHRQGAAPARGRQLGRSRSAVSRPLGAGEGQAAQARPWYGGACTGGRATDRGGGRRDRDPRIGVEAGVRPLVSRGPARPAGHDCRL